jgi:palmitoyltransferase
MTTDPGEVPPYWGFYMGDPEYKRRRYCLMCHVFKPERCHHCSACNRCVLNMDHHCPWINNCVGFYNRKYFFLLLLYVICSTTMVSFALHRRAYDSVWAMWETR